MSTIQDDPLPIPIYVISATSLLLNAFFLVLYFQCPLKKIHSYKYFFLFTVLEDIVYTITFTPIIPRIISKNYFMIFIVTGVLNWRPHAFILHITYCMSFFVASILVTNGFVYRYLHLCRTQFIQNLPRKKTVIIAFFINLIVLSNIFIVIYVAFWPNDAFIHTVADYVDIPGLDINTSAFLGFSIKHSVNFFHLALTIEMMLLLVAMAVVNVYCAKKIVNFLKNAKHKSSFISLQRQMFILLLIQAACPLVFLVVPYCSAMFLLLTALDSTTFTSNISSILFNLYPVFNPLIMTVFIKDYRNYVLNRLKLKKLPGQVISTVNQKSSRTLDPHRRRSTFVTMHSTIPSD